MHTLLWGAREWKTGASEQKSHTQSPRQTVCLKPALRAYARLCPPAGMNIQQSWALWLFGVGKMVTLILFSCDSFQTTREQKVSVTTGPRFALLPSSLSDVSPPWKMSCGKHSPTVWHVKFIQKPKKGGNLTFHIRVTLLCSRQPLRWITKSLLWYFPCALGYTPKRMLQDC